MTRLSAQNYEHFATLERDVKKMQAKDPALFSILGASGNGTKHVSSEITGTKLDAKL